MLNRSLYILSLSLFLLTGCKDATNKTETSEEANNNSPKLTEAELLDTVQKQTLKYFWDFAEPNSGMARERFHPDGNYPKDDKHVVTTGGTGFGLMALVAGVERGFIPKDSALIRFNKIADFLDSTPRFHGAWSHWLNGETGEIQAFGQKDNGGDIVETFIDCCFVKLYIQIGKEFCLHIITFV